MNPQKIAEKNVRWSQSKKSGASGYTENTPPKTRLSYPPKGGVKARGALLFRCGFPVSPSRYAGVSEREPAKNCRKRFRCCFRCRWRDFRPYTLFKGTELQLLPITALADTRAYDAERQGPRRFLRTAGLGCCAVLCCAVLTGWLYPTHCARVYAAPAGAQPMAPAQPHNPRVVGSCDSQLVVLWF